MYQHDKYNRILFSFINHIQETEEQAFQNEKLSRDLTYTEVHVVYELGKYNDPQAMNVIAQDLGITQSSLTSLVDKIEKKGYLQRIREPNDRRLVCLELSKKGQRLNQFHTDYHKNLVNKIHGTLTELELDSFFSNLQKLNESMAVPVTLDQLKIGESATVKELTTNGSLKTRLMEMGIIRGTTLKLLKIAPLGDPLEIQVRGSLVSIRKHEASQIQVIEPEEVFA